MKKPTLAGCILKECFLAGLLLLSGCVPFPHKVTASPRIQGIITNGDTPLANIKAFLIHGGHDQRCQTIKEPFVLTNEEGQFVVEESTRWKFLYAPLVSPLSVSQYTLCIVNSDQVVLGHRGLFSLYNNNEVETLKCDMSHPQVIKYSDGFFGEAVCDNPQYSERRKKYLRLKEKARGDQ